MGDIYVIVAENDRVTRTSRADQSYYDDGGPIVFEQYVKTADLESIKRRIASLGGRYGECRIAKLQFID